MVSIVRRGASASITENVPMNAVLLNHFMNLLYEVANKYHFSTLYFLCWGEWHDTVLCYRNNYLQSSLKSSNKKKSTNDSLFNISSKNGTHNDVTLVSEKFVNYNVGKHYKWNDNDNSGYS